MALKLSPARLSRELANSTLTRADCALLRPLAQKSTLSISELVPSSACHRVVVSSPVKGGNAQNQGEASAKGGEVALNLGEAPLPCLLINNSITGSCEDKKAVGSPVPVVPVPIPSWVRKAGFIVKTNIHAMCEKYGINNIGFLTLTFADDVQCHKEATKRLNSLLTNVLNVRYSQWVRVSERQKSGRWHFHLVVVCKQDIRRGFNHAHYESNQKNRKIKGYKKLPHGANKALSAEWQFWIATSKKYGFGRPELLPVKKTGEALAAYVAKYISKGFSYRRHDDKGARLVSYSKNARVCGSRFSFVGGRSHQWRLRCKLFLDFLSFRHHQQATIKGEKPLPWFTYDDMPSLFGKRWAWRLRDQILSPMFFNPFY
jgi:hypothetical protein